MRIYAACLASYNNGVLHGRWIDASSDSDAMQDEVSAMLRESRFPNVRVTCPQCEGRKEQTFHNSESGATRQGTCLVCDGVGNVPSAEEFAIHDMEGLPSYFGEYVGLKTVAEFVALTEEYDHIGAEDIAKIVDHFGDVESARDNIGDIYAGTYSSFRDYADEYADDIVLSGCDNETAMRYFDYAAFARDLAMDMTVIDVESGVAVFHA